MASKGLGGDAPALGHTWDEMDAEGRQYMLHGKDRIALVTFDKAADTPGGCGWPVFANRADCKLHVLDFPGALDDAVRALDRQALEQRERQESQPAPAGAVTTASDALWREAELEDALVLASRLSSRRQDPQGGLLIGDPRGQRVEGLKADIRHALGPAVGRVMRRDLLRAMLRHKGVNTKRLTAGQRLSWVTLSSLHEAQKYPEHAGLDPDTPLPLPIVWGVTTLATGCASDTVAEDAESDESEEEEERETEGKRVSDGKKEEGDEKVVEAGEAGEEVRTEAENAGAEAAEKEAMEEEQGEENKENDGEVKEKTKPKQADGDLRRWGWLKQIPGHDHICADPLVAAQADRIAELRVLGQLERDRGYLRWLLGELESVQERPSDQRATDCGCPPCPGPNLNKWEDYGLRAEAVDSRQDPLAHSKWEAQDLCRKTLDGLNHMVKAELRCKPRYLHPGAGRGPSAQMRAERAVARRERTFSTVSFMMRRLHNAMRSQTWRDAEPVGERLTEFLERLPCKIFPGRLDALARVLDCRATAARRRKNSKTAISLQKRRCTLAVDHGMAALYARALDEVALLLFSVADYPLASTSWCERLARLQQGQLQEGEEEEEEGGEGGGGDVQRQAKEEKVQVLFQLARTCFVQGYLRMAGPKASKQGVSRKDHRRELQEFSLGQLHVASDLALRSDFGDSDAAEAEAEDEQEAYTCEWEETCRWRLDLLGYDLGDDSSEVNLDEVEMGPVELKPNSLEACLRMINLEMDTEDPVGQYGHLLAVERYPDMEDAGRKYPLMPPDFNLEDNVMNKEYEVFERRFRDACQFLVCEITGRSPDSPTAPGQESSAAPAPAAESGGPSGAEAPIEPKPDPSRLPSVTEEAAARAEEQPPPTGS